MIYALIYIYLTSYVLKSNMMGDWTEEEEKSLAILLSIIDIGGYGTKKRVLDNIRDRDYLKFDETDLGYVESKDELKWRNDLAWIRDHLVKAGYIDNKIRNEWRITQQGKLAFCGMVYRYLKELTKPNPRKPAKLTNKWYKRIKEIIRRECPNMIDNLNKLLPDAFDYIDKLP